MAKKSEATAKEAKAKKTTRAAGTQAKNRLATAPKSKGKDENAILEALLKEYKFNNTQGVKNEDLAKKSGGNKTSDWFIKAKKSLLAKHFIEQGTEGGYVLSEEGAIFMGYAKTDLSQMGTNEEFHHHIKEQFDPKWKGAKIFDLLVQHGPQTRKELAEKSYGLKEIKATEYVTEIKRASSKMMDLRRRPG